MLLKVIVTLGAIVFVCSVPIIFSVWMYLIEHPEKQKKFQEECIRHKKLFTVLELGYVAISLVGIVGTFLAAII